MLTISWNDEQLSYDFELKYLYSLKDTSICNSQHKNHLNKVNYKMNRLSSDTKESKQWKYWNKIPDK